MKQEEILKMNQNQINFKDLSLWLKIGIVGGLIEVIVSTIFIIGFIIGLIIGNIN